MKRFVEGEDRRQATLLPDTLEDYVREDNPVRVIDVFIDELDLEALGFAGVVREVTGRPAYHPATLLKIYLYGYLNRIQSSRRLEREIQRNIELMWLIGLRGNRCAALRSQDANIRQRQARPFHRRGLHLRRQEGPLHLPGGPTPDQGKGAPGSPRPYQLLPKSHGLFELRAQAQMHARQGETREALGA